MPKRKNDSDDEVVQSDEESEAQLSEESEPAKKSKKSKDSKASRLSCLDSNRTECPLESSPGRQEVQNREQGVLIGTRHYNTRLTH